MQFRNHRLRGSLNALWASDCLSRTLEKHEKMRNESLHLIIERTFSQLQPDLFAIFSATNFWNFKESLAIPPFMENTNGVNVPCSTFIMLLLYYLFFIFHVLWRSFQMLSDAEIQNLCW